MKRPLCTVLIPFDAPGAQRFAVLKELGDGMGFDTFRVAQYYSSGVILEEIVRSISDATLVIADLTDGNPNVYYELGIAHALGKRVFVVAEDPDVVHVDDDDDAFLIHRMDSSPAGRERLRHELSEFQRTPGLLSPISFYTGGLAVAGQKLIGRRLAGFVIDLAILISLSIPFMFVSSHLYAAVALATIGVLAYFFVSGKLLRGTPGQRMLSLTVIRLDRSQPSAMQQLMRPVAIALCFFTWGIGFLWAAKAPRYQAMQDRISSTLVVSRVDRQKPA